jgi:lambda repressor-like predicted transcriptional regulator
MVTAHMDNPTAPTDTRDWRTVLREQGRTMRWLAIQTGKSPRTVYAYSQGQLTPTREWIADASRVLSQEVTA